MTHPTPAPDDRQSISDLVNIGLWALDTRDLELYLSTYWPDATFSEVDPAGNHNAWHGIDDIRAVSAERTGGPTGRQHRVSNTLFTPLGKPGRTGWVLWSYWMTTVRHPETGAATFEMTGYLRDEVEVRDGEWRMLGRHLGAWPAELGHPLRAAVS